MEIRFGHLALSVGPEVYPPAEDSFLLAKEAEKLRGRILEIGCGSGIASLSAALADRENEVLGVDINPEAVRCARENAEANGVPNARFIESDMFSNVPEGRFDAILFNPPYLPTSGEERMEGRINAAFDGGRDGRAVLDRFLERFDDFLEAGGTLLLVQSSLNSILKTEKRLEALGYEVESVAEERFFFERICLIRAIKIGSRGFPSAPARSRSRSA